MKALRSEPAVFGIADPQIRIEEVDSRSASLLSGMHRECFEPREFWDAEFFVQLLDQGAVCFLASLYGEPAGFLLGRCAGSEAEILTFCVLSPWRGRGVGGVLLGKFAAHACTRGVENLFLEVAVNNHAARHLYGKEGFEQQGVRKNYYPSGADALVLVKSLAEEKERDQSVTAGVSGADLHRTMSQF